jgi:hypothetical protein
MPVIDRLWKMDLKHLKLDGGTRFAWRSVGAPIKLVSYPLG